MKELYSEASYCTNDRSAATTTLQRGWPHVRRAPRSAVPDLSPRITALEPHHEPDLDQRRRRHHSQTLPGIPRLRADLCPGARPAGAGCRDRGWVPRDSVETVASRAACGAGRELTAQ